MQIAGAARALRSARPADARPCLWLSSEDDFEMLAADGRCITRSLIIMAQHASCKTSAPTSAVTGSRRDVGALAFSCGPLFSEFM